MKLSHKQLVGSLADHQLRRGYLVFAEVALGSKWIRGSCPVPDIFTCKKSYGRPDYVAYEVKASRADFLADRNAGKYQRYQSKVGRLYFACPAGMLKVLEIPQDAGLVVRNSETGAWTVVKSSPRFSGKLDEQELQSLLFAHPHGPTTTRRLLDRVVWGENAKLKDRAKGLGYQIRQALRDLEEHERMLTEAGPSPEREALDDICELLGLTKGIGGHSVTAAVRRLSENVLSSDLGLKVEAISLLVGTLTGTPNKRQQRALADITADLFEKYYPPPGDPR